MKKTSKLFGAVALSAALAIGTALPAFAAATDTNVKTEASHGGAQTTAKISTSIPAIDCTIPLEVHFSTPITGGKLVAPGDYGITNNSESGDLYVTNMKFTNFNEAGWGFKTTDDGVSSSLVSDKTYGDISVNMSYPKADGSGDSTAVNVKATSEVKFNEKTDTADFFKLTKKNGTATATKALIKFSGKNSPLKKAINNTDADRVELFKVTYTVSYNPSNATAYTLAS
ncbi:hypothetical protein [Adlercreutzia sp. ZJ154]|uniref:hypothetical protein n=1 Tax=Adlercreutzia sp. ZJ154 TaxID=2709790 RepID=UPI0013EB4B78|nr:hypothetical protein [Adlercreutzia sp. ZJ154]